MVRPDDRRHPAASVAGSDRSGCIDPAGVSPVQVSVGAPGSRLPAEVERPNVEAQRREPGSTGEQARGPQPSEVNVAASSDDQPKGVREGRAGHVTAKATDSDLEPKRSLDLPGVETAARAQGSMRNGRGPTRSSTSEEGEPISAERETASCREGVRGGRSSDEAADNVVERRTPASVVPSRKDERGHGAKAPNHPREKARQL